MFHLKQVVLVAPGSRRCGDQMTKIGSSQILSGQCAPSNTQKVTGLHLPCQPLLRWLLVAMEELPVAMRQELAAMVLGEEISLSRFLCDICWSH